MRLSHLTCLLALLFAVAGCGGGGTASGSGSSAAGAVFATDSLDNHAHVWVTIQKIVLLSATGDVTAFDDPNGVAIDLRSLQDPNGARFSFLANVPQGTYTG